MEPVTDYLYQLKGCNRDGNLVTVSYGTRVRPTDYERIAVVQVYARLDGYDKVMAERHYSNDGAASRDFEYLKRCTTQEAFNLFNTTKGQGLYYGG